jgi:hypothetical protein
MWLLAACLLSTQHDCAERDGPSTLLLLLYIAESPASMCFARKSQHCVRIESFEFSGGSHVPVLQYNSDIVCKILLPACVALPLPLGTHP